LSFNEMMMFTSLYHLIEAIYEVLEINASIP